MPEFATGSVVVAAALLVHGLARFRAWRGMVGLGLLIGVIAFFVVRGVLRLPEIHHLPTWTGLDASAGLLALAAAYQCTVVPALRPHAPGLSTPGSAWLLGALVGGPSSAGVAALPPASGSARLGRSVSATAGAWLGRAANPVLVVMAARMESRVLWALAAASLLAGVASVVAGRERWPMKPVVGVLVLVALAAQVTSWAPWAFGLGTVALIALERRSIDRAAFGRWVHALCGIALVILAAVAGLPEWIATGVEVGLRELWLFGPAAVVLAAALIGMLFDVWAAALLAVAVADRALDAPASFATWFALGLSLGVLGAYGQHKVLLRGALVMIPVIGAVAWVAERLW